ncbi:MAG: hypothetical protein ABI232_12590, partial [Jatrophihabitantaceae bacterium]
MAGPLEFDTTATDPDAPDINRLGRGAAMRMRRPGPPLGRLRSSRPGSVASAVQRFAASMSRPIAVRRTLEGPAAVPVHSPSGSAVAPPRWWTPERVADPDPSGSVAVADLPARGLPRAVRRVPNEQTWRPGGIAAGMRPDVVQVGRPAAVTAAGPMLTQQDHARLTPSRPAPAGPGADAANSTGSADPPTGQSPGGGSGPSASPEGATAVSRTATAQPVATPSRQGRGSSRPAP